MKNLNHCKTETVSPSDIRWGDTVVIGGEAITVGKKDLPKNGFMGWTFRGGRVSEMTRVLFPRWFKGEIIGYQPQV